MIVVKCYIAFILLAIISLDLNAQNNLSEGKVSFVTSNSIYVRFSNTQNISVGDTLSVATGGEYKSCLVVVQKSSSSCVCNNIADCELLKGSAVFHRKRIVIEDIVDTNPNDDEVETVQVFDTDSIQLQINDAMSDQEVESIENIYARISASSYSSLDPEYGNRHRMMWRFAFNANRINNSKLSIDSYINYRRSFDEVSNTTSSQNSVFRIYNAAIKYQLDSSTVITAGRKINRRMSSVGAIDGIQLDKSLGRIYTGLVLGFKPNISDFGFNPRLLQYGLYFGKDLSSRNGYGQFTMGILEQRNGSAIDRRYTYLQFNSNLKRKINLFGSAEVDLYENISSSKQFKPKLTNLYLSAGYKFNRNVSLSFSFDSRKRIIYYETLRTELERLLADDEARQGIRARLNIRPLKMVYLGISYSRRFQNDNQNKSDNINGFVSLSRVPGIGGRINFNYNQNKSNYLNSKIYSGRYSRPVLKSKLDVDLYYRYVRYDYFNTETLFSQYYAGLGLSWNVAKNLSFNILVERSEISDDSRYRVNTRLIKRFRSN